MGHRPRVSPHRTDPTAGHPSPREPQPSSSPASGPSPCPDSSSLFSAQHRRDPVRHRLSLLAPPQPRPGQPTCLPALQGFTPWMARGPLPGLPRNPPNHETRLPKPAWVHLPADVAHNCPTGAVSHVEGGKEPTAPWPLKCLCFPSCLWTSSQKLDGAACDTEGDMRGHHTLQTDGQVSGDREQQQDKKAREGRLSSPGGSRVSAN